MGHPTLRSASVFSLGLLSLTGFLLARPQQDFSKVEIRAYPAGGTVTMLEGQGGNIGISVGDDGVLMIDDQFAPLEPKIREAIGKVSKKPIKFLLNTHFHGDHTGGNAAFGKDSTIVAHANVRKRLETGGGRGAPAAKEALPIVTYDDAISIHFNGEEVKIFHVAGGHTDGDSIIQFTKSNVIHMGDDFFHERFPFIDLSSGGNVKGYIAAAEKVLSLANADTKIIPGHGRLATVEDLKGFLAFLKDAVAIVGAAMKEGKTLDQMKSDKILAKYDKMNWQFINSDKFLADVVGSLK